MDAFKGFDQGQHSGLINTMPLENDEEPRRGASRANSVRFDESAIHGYYGQVSRSSSELPLRTGSGIGSHPLTERSSSHRSEGRQSSSGHSHHSARTYSMGLDTARLVRSGSGSPPPATMPPPGLFLLGPVPCIIRCWLTTTFSNDSLLYAAVCSGSCASFLGYPLIEKLGLEDQIFIEDGVRFMKLPLYLPEASIHQSSPRASNPIPQLPAVTVRFIVRNTDPDDPSIQIVVGSDVLRSHNADILFSQDKLIMVDDERNRVSIPLVRPENDAVFKTLCTGSGVVDSRGSRERLVANGHVGVIGRPPSRPQQETSAPSPCPTDAVESPVEQQDRRPERLPPDRAPSERPQSGDPEGTTSTTPTATTKADSANVWGSWRREPRSADLSSIGMAKSNRGRTMKVLRPSKPSSTRVPTSTSTSTNTSTAGETTSASSAVAGAETGSSGSGGPEIVHPTPSRSASFKGEAPWTKSQRGTNVNTNPVGGASAFGWLNQSR